MPTYQLTHFDTVLRLADGAAIPQNPANADYQRYLAWVEAGNTPDPADPAAVVYGRTLTVDQRLRTTTATPAEIARWTLATLTGYRVALELLAVDAGSGALRFIAASIVAKRLGNGAALVGAPVVVANHQDAAASTWAIVAAVSGNDVVITVAGAAGRSIDWQLTGRVLSFTPGGQP